MRRRKRKTIWAHLDGTNLSDCLCFDDGCDSHEYFVEGGELRAVGVHHDGTNRYVFRELIDPDLMSDEDYDDIMYDGASTDVILKNSRSLAPDVCKVYGWAA